MRRLVPRPPTRLPWASSGLVFVLVGCAEPAGFLDASTVSAVMQDVGNEVGTERSAAYSLTAVGRECGCDLEPGLQGLSLCAWFELGGMLSGDQASAAVVVEATDGAVVLRLLGAPNAVLVGPIDHDGQFSAGAVTTLKTFVADGSLVTRIDGGFDRASAGYTFEAELAHRIRGNASVQEEKPRVDCEERLSVSASPVDPFGP